MNEKNVAYHIKEHLMKRNMLAVCLLLSVCLPIFCMEIFMDNGDRVSIDYITINGSDDEMRAGLNALSAADDITFISDISKPSNRDRELINKALSKFSVEKGEIYFITLEFISGATWGETQIKFFAVKVTNVNKQGCEWKAYGRAGTHPWR